MCALQARLVIGGEPSTPALVEALLLQCGNARCALTTQAVNNRHTAQLSIYTSVSTTRYDAPKNAEMLFCCFFCADLRTVVGTAAAAAIADADADAAEKKLVIVC